MLFVDWDECVCLGGGKGFNFKGKKGQLLFEWMFCWFLLVKMEREGNNSKLLIYKL